MSGTCSTHLSNSRGGNQQLVVVDPHDGASFVFFLLVQPLDGLPQCFQRAVGELLVHPAVSLQMVRSSSYSFFSKTPPLLMEAASPPEMSVTSYQSTRHYTPEDCHLYQQYCENLTFHILLLPCCE